MENEQRRAYITLLDNDEYIYSFIACYSSWLRTESIYPFYCAYTDGTSLKLLRWLEQLKVKTIKLDKLHGLDKLKAQLKDSHYTSWIPALQKLAIYGLDQFDKIIFLDADTYLYANIDHLFDLPHLSGVPDGIGRNTPSDKFKHGDNYYKKFNAGMLVIEPSKQLMNRILQLTQSLPPDRPWADQNIVSELYPNWVNEVDKHLPVYYNCFGRHICEYEHNIPDFNPSNIKVLHLVGRKMSPEYGWENVFNSSKGLKHNTYCDLLIDICEKVNLFIYEQQKKGNLIELRPVKLPQVYDLVVPYVDSSDPHWISLFEQYNPYEEEIEAVNAPNRFRGQGNFFKYFFKGVDKYASWIRRIFLIVQSPSQVPSWVNEYPKVKIVYHHDFIPAEYLPTFNSTCIEMFVPHIKGLSEYFLYANDDMFFYNHTNVSDFFKGGIPLKRFQPANRKINMTMYDSHCLNSYCCAFEIESNKIHTYDILCHVIRPYVRSCCLQCFNKNEFKILKSISRFRESKNFNMYLYDLYSKRLGQVRENGIRSEAIFTFSRSNIDRIVNSKCSVICINDGMSDTNIYEDEYLNKCFKEHYDSNVTSFAPSTS